ncbi:hypothetical protein [Cupriavidus nantongensis]|uniref:Uncharacterized protein n=1 Tax=Cupriavidus nantongensis TaxID=1796606 RepID=A0A142JIS5_9BURK|nr:hypothetical protein [Cupriavidus nantongensis]AMR77987.1 hypothetical protein A2G96_09675 [Cupriavidus nantongensis]
MSYRIVEATPKNIYLQGDARIVQIPRTEFGEFVVRPGSANDFQVVLKSAKGEFPMGAAFGVQQQAEEHIPELQKKLATMKIAAQVKDMLANADPVWAMASADLAHAVIERAAGMSPDELRAFVAGTTTGARFATAGDKELQATAAAVARALI